MPDPLDREPTSFIAGDTVSWTKSLADFDAADSWALTYEFRGNIRKTITADADGSNFLATITAAISATFTPGTYYVTAYATKAGERFTVWQGRCEIKFNPAQGHGSYDGRSHARKCLEAIEKTLEGNMAREEADYSINFGGTSRQLRLCTKPELIQARNYYLAEVRREEQAERIAQGRKSGNRILTRFER